MILFLLGAGLTVLGLAWEIYWRHPGWPGRVNLSPDGRAYLEMAQGNAVARSYHVRWLLPLVLGTRLRAWQATSLGSLVLTGGLLTVLAGQAGLEPWQAGLAALLFASLPIARICIMLPVLADGPGLALLVAAVLADRSEVPGLSLILVALGASVRETVPLFAACATLNPWLLLGLVVPALRVVLVRRASTEPRWATDPLGYARSVHLGHSTAAALVLPWGAGLAALFQSPLEPELVVSLVVAYGLTFASHDMVRNYQWALVPVLLAAVSTLPPWLVAPALVAHLFNPWQGEI